jgi:hypothetical protein
MMFIASIITAWFVARDAANFEIIQMVISLLLITLLLAIAAFWPYLVAWFDDWRGARLSRAGTNVRGPRPPIVNRDSRK